MAESRYGVRIGRPPKGDTSGVVRNIRLHPDLDARVVAFQRRGEWPTYTAALEELITIGTLTDAATAARDTSRKVDKVVTQTNGVLQGMQDRLTFLEHDGASYRPSRFT